MFRNLTLKERKKLLENYMKEISNDISSIKTNKELDKIIDILSLLLKNYKSDAYLIEAMEINKHLPKFNITIPNIKDR